MLVELRREIRFNFSLTNLGGVYFRFFRNQIVKVKRYKAMWVQLCNIDLAFRNTASRHTHPSYVPGPCQKARRLAWQYSRGAPWLLNDGSCGGGRDDLKNIGV